MVFLMLLALSVAAPKVAKEIQRDKEREAMQRGLQYRRAIQLYYKKFGAYPADIKQLEKTNEIRFLRKRYTDPITGKDDWRLIHMGEAKVPPLGFFGQPLQAGLSSVSTGPGNRAASTPTATRTTPATQWVFQWIREWIAERVSKRSRREPEQNGARLRGQLDLRVLE